MRRAALILLIATTAAMADEKSSWELVCAQTDGRLMALRGADEPRQIGKLFHGYPASASLSPAGDRLAYVRNKQLWVHDITTKRPDGLVYLDPHRTLRWTSDGKSLVVSYRPPGDKRSAVWLIDAATAGRRKIAGHENGVYEPIAAARGDWVAYLTYRTENEVIRADEHDIRVVNRRSGKTRKISDHSDGAVMPRFCPDGKRLAYLQRHPEQGAKRPRPMTLHVVTLESDERTVIIEKTQVVHVAWGPRGRILAISVPGEVRFFDTVERKVASTLSLKTINPKFSYHAVRDIRWRPDGVKMSCRIDYLGQLSSSGLGGKPSREDQMFSGAGTWLIETPATAPPAPPVTEEDRARIEVLIGQLGARAFKRRERATRELVTIGRKAIPQLKASLKGSELEVVSRLRSILSKLAGARFLPELTSIGWRGRAD